MLLPRGPGPFLGSQTQRWGKAAAVTSGGAALTFCLTSIYSPCWCRHIGHIGTRLHKHLPVTACCSHHSPFEHMEGLDLWAAVSQHRVALPLVWTPMQFPCKIRHPLSADSPSTGTDPCRAAECFSWAPPFGSFVFGNRPSCSVSCIHGLMAKENLSNSTPREEE